jgi:predicted Holliday junction resolvase-like endonuclease
MLYTIFIIICIIIVALILHDIRRILELQDELIKEQYIMRGELNAILDMASIGSSFVPKFNVFSDNEEKEDKTTTVEVSN